MNAILLSILILLPVASRAADDLAGKPVRPAAKAAAETKSATDAKAKADARADAREARAEAKAGLIRFTYKNADINRVIEDYAKASGQKFVIDGQVKGHITIFNPAPITVEEAFNHLSTALAANSIGISTREDQMFVAPTRSIARDSIPVVTELPPMRPDRLVTLVVSLKYTNAEEINRTVRTLSSRDGEMVPYAPNNQLLITDWTPNLYRVAELIKQLDVPSENGTTAPPPAAIAQPADADPRPEVPTIPTLKMAPKPKGK